MTAAAAMTPLDVLRGARALIEDPSAWHSGADAAYFGLAGRVDCDALDDQADCWCLAGAAIRSCGSNGDTYFAAMTVVADVIDPAWRARPSSSRPRSGDIPWTAPRVVTAWNDEDERTHAEVIAAMDRAIARLEGEGV